MSDAEDEVGAPELEDQVEGEQADASLEDADAEPKPGGEGDGASEKDGDEKDGEAGEGEEDGDEGEEAAADDENLADSSEEDDDEAANEYEEDDFLVHGDDDEGGGDEDEGAVQKRKRKRQRKRRKEHALDEDDYDLLEENQVTNFKRHTGHKRLKSQAEAARKPTNIEDFRDELFGNEDLEDEVEDAGGRSGGSRRDAAERGGAKAIRPKPSSQRDDRGGRDGDRGRRDGDRERDRGGERDGRGRDPDGRRRDDDHRGGGGGDRRRDGGDREHDRGDGDAFDDLGDEEEDEMAGFIVDNEDGGGGGGGGGTPARRKKKKRPIGGAGAHISTAAMQDAIDIFGEDVDELLQKYSEAKASQAPGGHDPGLGDGGLGLDGDDELLEEEEDEEDLEGEGGEEAEEARMQRAAARAEARRIKMEAVQQQKIYQKAMKIMDPEQLARAHLRPEDQVVRDKDVPERLQVLGRDFTEPLDVNAAAVWVYERLKDGKVAGFEWSLLRQGYLEVDGSFPEALHGPEWWCSDLLGAKAEHGDSMTLGGNRAIREERNEEMVANWVHNPVAQEALVASIRTVLSHVFEKGEEVPLVGMYRKEGAGELLALRREDLPARTRYPTPRHPLGTIQAKHRRMRRWDVLWRVLDLALEYRNMLRRRSRLIDTLTRAIEGLEQQAAESVGQAAAMLDADVAALQEALRLCEAAESADMVTEVQTKLTLIIDCYPDIKLSLLSIGIGSGGSQAGQAMATTKRPARASNYRILKTMGLQMFVNEMVLSPARFALNLADTSEVVHPENVDSLPQDWSAAALLTLANQNPEMSLPTSGEDLIERLKMMATQELVAEPGVKTHLRAKYYEEATLSTQPTELGNRVLDPFHRYALTKRLDNKPLHELEGSDLMLRIARAEADGLITVKMQGFHEVLDGKLLNDIVGLYKSEDVSRIAKEWDVIREVVVREAILKHLFPSITSSIRVQLLARAKEAAYRRYSDELWHLASRPPLRIKIASTGDDQREGHDEEDFIERPRLMVVLYGNQAVNPTTNKPNSTAVVVLNEQGNMSDFFYCGQLSGNIKRSGLSANDLFNDPAKAKDVQRLKDKIQEHVPAAILVGYSAPQCKQLAEDLKRICDSFLEDNVRFMKDNMEADEFHVIAADEKVAALWENCAAAKSEFRDHSAQIRRAVAVGRMHIDPLSVLTSLAGPDRELLSLRLTDLQDGGLDDHDLMRAAERTFVTAVAQVGVDLNLAAHVSWRAPPLAYVPGLGPRKAAALLKGLQRNGNRVSNRTELYKGWRLLPKTVYRNAGPYLRISAGGLPQLSNMELRALDATRIHPESYRLAMALVQAATGDDDVEAAVEDPARIDEVDVATLVPAAATVGKSLPTLIDIQQELVVPYGDLRGGLSELSEREKFLLQYHESEETLRQGRLVEVRITYVLSDYMKCTLVGSGAEARIPLPKVSDRINSDHNVNDLKRFFTLEGGEDPVGQVKQGRVIGLVTEKDSRDGTERVVVEVTTLSSEVKDYENVWEIQLVDREKRYMPLSKDERKAANDRRKALDLKQNRVALTKRPIHHPFFKNVTASEAAEALVEGDKAAVGSCIIRPHSKNRPDCLQVTILLHRSQLGTVIMHVDITEAPKAKGAGAHLTVAYPLTIDIMTAWGQTPGRYEDLDELQQRFVERMFERMQQVVTHRKYKEMSKLDLDALVMAESRPNGPIPYYLSVDYSKPALCGITFALNNSKANHEMFYVTPEGFYFRRKTYSDLDRMLNDFKKNPVQNRNQPGTGYHINPNQAHATFGAMQTGMNPMADPNAARYGYAGLHHPAPQYGMQPSQGGIQVAAGYGQGGGGMYASQQVGYGGQGGGGGYGSQQQHGGYNGSNGGYSNGHDGMGGAGQGGYGSQQARGGQGYGAGGGGAGYAGGYSQQQQLPGPPQTQGYGYSQHSQQQYGAR